MKFDRNTATGFALLAILFFAYFWYNNKEQQAYQKNKQLTQAKTDSANRVKAKADSIANAGKQAVIDSQKQVTAAGDFQKYLQGKPEEFKVSTDLVNVVFTNKGGQVKYVELKKFKHADSSLVRLAGSDFDKINYAIKTSASTSASVTDLYFTTAGVTQNADKSQTISFTLADSAGTGITHQFMVKPNDYMVDFTIGIKGTDKLVSQGMINLKWQYKAAQQESGLGFEKENTQVGYVMDDEFDYHTIARRSSKEFKDPVKWLGIRQRFFTTLLVAKNNFSGGKIEWAIPSDKEKTVVQSTADLDIKVAAQSENNIPLSLYYGPADYHILQQYDMKMGKLINLGQAPYGFVRPINKYVIMPIWDFLKKNIASFGLVIALLTLFIRLLTSPLMYPGYLTSAKMKVLRPELAKLKERYPDQQQYAMEQMKFLREAGVNSFAGCLPSLLQIPIFFALYSFFNSNVDLRGQDFLWANDLSAFDEVIKFGVNIPLLGSHLSLFTITAVLTSFLISFYSMSMSPDQSNPVLKYLPYIFPFFLLFIFNRLPSALTWYYTVSNVITLLLQYVIQHYIINHDKIVAKIEENRKKPKPKSKWAEAMERMQEQQKQMKEAQNKKR